MKRIPLIFVAALLGAVVSLPSQSRNESRSVRSSRGAVVTNTQARLQPSRRAPAPNLRAPSVPQHRSASRLVRNVGRALGQVAGCGVGYWETHYDRVLVPGYWSQQQVPPTYGWIFDSCGHRSWGIVDPGGCRRVWIPERWEDRPHQVWVSGRVGHGWR